MSGNQDEQIQGCLWLAGVAIAGLAGIVFLIATLIKVWWR